MLLQAHTPHRTQHESARTKTTTRTLWYATSVNVLVIFGVALLDWSMREVIILFWIETLIIGIMQWLKLLASKIWVAVVSLPLYGFFVATWYVGAVFTILILSVNSRTDLKPGSFNGDLHALLYELSFPIALIVVSHLVEFILNFIVTGKHKSYLEGKINWITWFLNVPSRFVVIVCTVALGIIFSIFFPNTQAVLYIFVLGKLIVDVLHQRYSRGNSTN